MLRLLALACVALALAAACTAVTVDGGMVVGPGGIARLTWPAAWHDGVCAASDRTEQAVLAVATGSNELGRGNVSGARLAVTAARSLLADASNSLEQLPAWPAGAPVAAGLARAVTAVGDAATAVHLGIGAPRTWSNRGVQRSLSNASDAIRSALEDGAAVGFSCPAPRAP